MRVAPTIVLSDSERLKLVRASKGRGSSQRLKERAQIILLAAEGLENKEIAVRLGQDPGKVGRWRKRYAEYGFAGIEKDKTRPGRIKSLSPSMKSKVIKLTLETKPAGSTHWSRSAMARKAGISESSVGRIWACNGLTPRGDKNFKLSNGINIGEKHGNTIGLQK